MLSKLLTSPPWPLIALFFLFVLATWYQGLGQPLTSTEINGYLNKIAAQKNNPGQHDLAALETFMRADDGAAFYTVNLYKFNQQAQYATTQSEIPVSGLVAFDRFSQTMLQLLAQHASHPIYASNWISESDWQQLVIVRYRSRRDLIDIFASDAFAQASIHKWAGLRQNQRLLVRGMHIPELLLPFGLFGFLLLVLWRQRSRFIKQVSVSESVIEKIGK